MPKKRQKIYTKEVLKLFWDHTKRHPWLFSLAGLGAIVSQATSVIGPLYIKDIFNLLTAPGVVLTTALFTPVILYALVRFIGWMGDRLEMWLGYSLISLVTAELTKEAFANLMRHSFQFFSSSFSGALTRRVGRFSGAYENLYYSLVSVLFEAILYVAGVVLVLSLRNWILGAVVLFWVVLFIAVQWWLAPLATAAQAQARRGGQQSHWRARRCNLQPEHRRTFCGKRVRREGNLPRREHVSEGPALLVERQCDHLRHPGIAHHCA